MKVRFLLAVFFVAARAAAGPAAPPAPEPVGRVLQAGIYARSGPVVKYEAPGTPTGLSSRHLGPSSLITATNRIPAALGISFGIGYEVTNLPDTPGKPIEIVQTVVHPPMNIPGRGISKGFTVATKHYAHLHRVVAGSSYTFEYPYEMVPGVWEFEISVLGKTVVRQSFMVVPPVAEATKAEKK